eukprot:1158158-Pelagomonas_calceolata.AAC.7
MTPEAFAHRPCTATGLKHVSRAEEGASQASLGPRDETCLQPCLASLLGALGCQADAFAHLLACKRRWCVVQAWLRAS